MLGGELFRTTLALWPQQHAALDTVEAYLAPARGRACLVNMPTGTGKTGLMATIARQRAQVRPVLVVCPSAALVEHLIAEFDDRSWDKIGANPA